MGMRVPATIEKKSYARTNHVDSTETCVLKSRHYSSNLIVSARSNQPFQVKQSFSSNPLKKLFELVQKIRL